MTRPPTRILPTIVLSQFTGASLWFAGNAVLPDLQRSWGLPPEALGDLTAAVQLGFIAGTLSFAVLAVSDRYSPRKIYLVCSLLGALANAAAWLVAPSLIALLGLRFATGFFLAGIYPVGMKIASGWYRRDLGKALGFLVGALVLGTAFPHLVRGLGQALPWQAVLFSVSALAVCGGAAMFALVPDGPYLQAGSSFHPRALVTAFRSARFRASSFGYFGHMWELYAFWAFVPPLLTAYGARTGHGALDVPLCTFAVIAAGALGCIGGGLVSCASAARRSPSPSLAHRACAAWPRRSRSISPRRRSLPTWSCGASSSAGDSPQFSALNARYAPSGLVGSALTIVNSIGFAITILSIQLFNHGIGLIGVQYVFLLLVPGPVLGLAALMPLMRAPGNAPASDPG